MDQSNWRMNQSNWTPEMNHSRFPANWPNQHEMPPPITGDNAWRPSQSFCPNEGPRFTSSYTQPIHPYPCNPQDAPLYPSQNPSFSRTDSSYQRYSLEDQHLSSLQDQQHWSHRDQQNWSHQDQQHLPHQDQHVYGQPLPYYHYERPDCPTLHHRSVTFVPNQGHNRNFVEYSCERSQRQQSLERPTRIFQTQSSVGVHVKEECLPPTERDSYTSLHKETALNEKKCVPLCKEEEPDCKPGVPSVFSHGDFQASGNSSSFHQIKPPDYYELSQRTHVHDKFQRVSDQQGNTYGSAGYSGSSSGSANRNQRPKSRSPSRRSLNQRSHVIPKSPNRGSGTGRHGSMRSPSRNSRRGSPRPSCSRNRSASRSPVRRSDSRSSRLRSPGRRSDNRSSRLRSPGRRSDSRSSRLRSPGRRSSRTEMRSPNWRSASQSRLKSPSQSSGIVRGRSPRGKSPSITSTRSSLDRSKTSQRTEDSGIESAAERKKRIIDKWRGDRNQKELNLEEILKVESEAWIRSAPSDRYYVRDETNLKIMRSTPKLDLLCQTFKEELATRGENIKATQTLVYPKPKKPVSVKHKTCFSSSDHSSSNSEDDGDDDDDDDDDCLNSIREELQRKQQHPYRLHPELWFNDPGEMNDGPLCRCSAKARRSGIRHGFYAGEANPYKCNPKTNNADRLYHYRVTVSPPNNFLMRTPTIICHDDHEFIFEGFSLISHYPIGLLPACKVIRFNIEYVILYIEEQLPENFTIEELDLFYNYLFNEILELVDFDLREPNSDGSCCPQFHLMPRFVRELSDRGRELLPMCEILKYLLSNNKPLFTPDNLADAFNMNNHEWQVFTESIKGMVVTKPGMKPCSIRVDQLDRDFEDDKTVKTEKCSSGRSCKVELNSKDDTKEAIEVAEDMKEANSAMPKGKNLKYPETIHFGIRPPQLSYAGNPEYQRAWRGYVKFRHLLANMPKPTQTDKEKLAAKEIRLQTMRTHSKMKRDVTVTVSSEGFYLTGLMCDVVQHAMLIPVLACHLRFHRSLTVLEKNIGYTFNNRYLLQLALTHPSYRENFGTNPDHARNSLTNCGIRQPEYGDRRIHYINTRKRGINTLINIMSKFGVKDETESSIYHNERLEFLGDAVIEFITSIHLFHMFRDLEEGGLATYRAALVQNQHLAVLAKKLELDAYMLYAHGSDLCHDLELRHAMANCFEALMGALFLDGGIDAADKVFGNTLYGHDEDVMDMWVNYPPHALQEQEPLGDRKWIPSFPFLQSLTNFEKSTGITFKHIRLLARAFTDRSVGYTNLTMGSNQRLEFLGDSVLQLVASEYLYKHFPEHHEGHLSLLRSSLVNNKTQSVVCDDIDMIKYALYGNPKAELKIKDKADLLEAFLGAFYVDTQDLDMVKVFCNVCFFPRLQDFILNQDWNDPKSKLQQCCLTLRTMEGGEPDIPIYKVVECKGPTNTRVYTVAVYFRHVRLAEAAGHSIQQAEMNAAQKAMEDSQTLFPQLVHQKKAIEKSFNTQEPTGRISSLESRRERRRRSRTSDTYKRTGERSTRSSELSSRTTVSSQRSNDFDSRSTRSSECSSRTRERSPRTRERTPGASERNSRTRECSTRTRGPTPDSRLQ